MFGSNVIQGKTIHDKIKIGFEILFQWLDRLQYFYHAGDAQHRRLLRAQHLTIHHTLWQYRGSECQLEFLLSRSCAHDVYSLSD